MVSIFGDHSPEDPNLVAIQRGHETIVVDIEDGSVIAQRDGLLMEWAPEGIWQRTAYHTQISRWDPVVDRVLESFELERTAYLNKCPRKELFLRGTEEHESFEIMAAGMDPIPLPDLEGAPHQAVWNDEHLLVQPNLTKPALIEVASGKKLGSPHHPTQIHQFVWSPEGDMFVATSSMVKSAYVYSVPTCKRLHVLQSGGKGIPGIHWNNWGILLSSRKFDVQLFLDGEMEFKAQFEHVVNSIKTSPSEDRVYLSDRGGNLHAVDRSGEILFSRRICEKYITTTRIGRGTIMALTKKKVVIVDLKGETLSEVSTTPEG